MSKLILPTFAGDPNPFIVTTPATQSIEERRKFIRSHVMRGKNRKQPSSRASSWLRPKNHENKVSYGFAFFIPPKVGGDFASTGVASDVTPDMLEAMYKLKQVVSSAGFGLDCHQTESWWFDPIWNDIACFHFTVFITKLYMNNLQGKKEADKAALGHLIKALAILQERLACGDNELSTSDSTILVVVGLTIAATATGDTKTSLKHLKGLHKMVLLRGGITAFNENRQLQTKILRADLAAILAMGCKPVFFPNDAALEPFIASRASLVSSGAHDTTPNPCFWMPTSDLSLFLVSLDNRLLLIWNDVSRFCRAANIATQCNCSIDGKVYQEAMVSIHYRLVNLTFELGTVNELIRLALLSFASSLFLQCRNLQMRWHFLSQGLQRSLTMLCLEPAGLPKLLTLWLYVVSAVSVFDEKEQVLFQEGLTQVLQDMGLKSWNEVRSALKSVLWVDELHDAPGRLIVNATMTQ